jgi:hypothetical protein
MGVGCIMISGSMITIKPGENTMMAGNRNITSSVNLMNIISQTIESKVNVNFCF